MKTIEERIEEIAEKWENMPNPYGSSVIDSALRELAADLQAEKEKEVAELRRERDLAIAHDRQPYPTAHAYEKVCEALNKVREEKDAMSATIAQQDALLDEVKRVLGMAENSALSWDMLGRAQGNIAVQIWREDALKLLTRLGGSHE